jgi:NADH-quinone oxidoreductase subunit L
MEGPTPVSALIHAATMVAAGVFLLIKLFPIFTSVSLTIVAITGAATALVAALCALNQFDMKRILAYSTISQLGLMVTAVGMGSANAALMHLFTHAFFKAALFLAIGSIIHSLHIQDIRELGGLKTKLPVTFFVCLLAGAALAGVPLTSGFVSKDAILTTVWIWTGTSFSWKWLVLLSVGITSFITVFYIFRMTWFIFFGKEKQYPGILKSPWIIQGPIILLAILSTWLLISINPFQSSGWFTNQTN